MTIEKMAEELGLSKSTVSRALSGKGRIGQETRDRVQEYARQMGLLAQGAVSKDREKTPNIGVIIPADAVDEGMPFFQECLLGVCEAAAILNYDVLVARGMVNNISGIMRLVENKKVDGIILTRSMEDDKALKYLTDIRFPVGVVGTCDYDGVIQVDTDNQGAAESLTSMLIGQGYHRFGLIVGDISYRVNRARYQGFDNAIERHGLARSHQVMYTGFTNMEMMDNLIGDMVAARVECIVCGDDVICSKVMSRLQAEGYRIPRDISIVSLFNSASLECFSPAVTAINISARQAGNLIGRQMIDCLRGNDYSQRTMMNYELLFRRSTDKIYQYQA